MAIRKPDGAQRKLSSSQLAYLRRLRLKEWSRPISPATYARGVAVCLENARSLLDDALLLMESGHRARAVALAVLALEEGDKPRQLLLLCMGNESARKQWKAFRSHGPKLAAALSMFTHGDYSIRQQQWASRKPKKGHDSSNPDLPHLAQVLKERCFHADLLADGTWSVPGRTVPRAIGEAIIGVASLQLAIATTLSLGADMVAGGQVECGAGSAHVDFTDASPRGRRWLRWRTGKAGQRWGAQEWAKHTRWAQASGARMDRIVRSAGVRR